MKPEALLKTKIRSFLTDEKKAYVFSSVQMGMGMATLDILCCVPKIITPEMVGRRYGLFAGVEAKTPGNKPTARQVFTMKQIQLAGGVAFWTDSLDYTKTMLEAAGL